MLDGRLPPAEAMGPGRITVRLVGDRAEVGKGLRPASTGDGTVSALPAACPSGVRALSTDCGPDIMDTGIEVRLWPVAGVTALAMGPIEGVCGFANNAGGIKVVQPVVDDGVSTRRGASPFKNFPVKYKEKRT